MESGVKIVLRHICTALSGHGFHHRAQHVRRGAVLPLLARLEGQRHFPDAVGDGQGIRLAAGLLLLAESFEQAAHRALRGGSLAGVAKAGGHGEQSRTTARAA
jgi:hypothetical protein